MVCFRKKALPPNIDQAQVTLDGEKLKFEDETSFLGITVDCYLNWDKHCTKVANTISRNNSIINRVRNILPPSSLKLLYYSFIQPHLQYGLTAWGGCSGQNRNRITAIQKRAIRTITKSYYMSHTEPRMKQIGILKLDDLYKQQCLMLTYDCINDSAPNQIKQLMIKEKNPVFNLRNHTQNPLNLKIPILKTRVGSNSFSIKGPTIWNGIPNEMKCINRRSNFKNAVKKKFLQGYNCKCECNNPRCTDKQHHQNTT